MPSEWLLGLILGYASVGLIAGAIVWAAKKSHQENVYPDNELTAGYQISVALGAIFFWPLVAVGAGLYGLSLIFRRPPASR